MDANAHITPSSASKHQDKEPSPWRGTGQTWQDNILAVQIATMVHRARGIANRLHRLVE
jgi:hypothetical protein